MIKIVKSPYIIENTDQWGRPLGTFDVVDVQGLIDEDMWSKIQEFEGYYLSEQRQNEITEVKFRLSNGNTDNFDQMIAMLPYMKKVIGYCGSQIWQFNLRISDDNQEALYVRSFAFFGEKTFSVWTPEHDEKVKVLKENVKLLNIANNKYYLGQY